ncbi:serine protease, partial [Streptomyces sp. NPDC005899]|uniref:serine protease n=1 Tax=Streptomyces sp. NPDC005899 TaxID=3155716 RepID=UPI0033E8547B
MGSGDRSTLVGICDQAGRPRGTGFVADDRGTVLTCHQAVAGAGAVVLHGEDGRTHTVSPGGITALPELGLALLATGGPAVLAVEPLPVAVRERVEAGTYVRIAAHGRREARVLGTTPATYTEGGQGHPLRALELALGTDGRDALRSGGAAVGGPVTDPRTGAVLAVLSTALRAGHEAAGLAVPLTGAVAADGPLGELLRRNANTVPGYGRDLNLAGALQLTATSLGHPGSPGSAEPVERPLVSAEFAAFEAGTKPVLGLVGAPGTGRTTELAALAARRSRGAVPALTLWLRGADLLADDTSVADAMTRVLGRSARIITAAGAPGDMTTATPERVAHLARASGNPLLVVVDGPEEMPPALAHRLAPWTAATAGWLRCHRVRMVVACRPEHWETAGALHPRGDLHRPARPARGLPPAVRLTDLTAGQAERARERYGIPPGAVAPGHDRHPLTLRLLAEVREALPPDVPGRPGTEEVFAAHLDLTCVRIAVRVGARAEPRLRGTAVRRLAAEVAGRVHEAARRCLGPGQGELDRAAFEEIFPWRTGWASAVLTEGLLIPAGAGYRFAHEELGDWLQGAHLDLDAALWSLVHRWQVEDAPEREDVPEREGGPDTEGRPETAEGPDTVGGPGTAGAPEPVPPRSAVRVHPAGPPGAGRAGEAGEAGAAGRAEFPAAGWRTDVVGPAWPVRPAGEPGPVAPAGLRAETPGPSVAGARASGSSGPRSLPVPRHRIGPVIQAMLLLERRRGTAAPAHRMADLIEAMDRLPGAGRGGGTPGRLADAAWWAAHLLRESLLGVPDGSPYLGVLRVLAGRIARRSRSGRGPEALGPYAAFGPWFWRRVRLPAADRLDLLRRLVPADGAPGANGEERFLDAVDRCLAAAPRTVQPLLCRWFTDETPLRHPCTGEAPPRAEDGATIRLTVAAAAQALLYARRDLAVD